MLGVAIGSASIVQEDLDIFAKEKGLKFRTG